MSDNFPRKSKNFLYNYLTFIYWEILRNINWINFRGQKLDNRWSSNSNYQQEVICIENYIAESLSPLGIVMQSVHCEVEGDPGMYVSLSSSAFMHVLANVCD